MKWLMKLWSPLPTGAKKISGMADPIAETRKRIAASTRPFLLPRFLLIHPPEIPPRMQPIRALETSAPSLELADSSARPRGSTKKLSRELTVPEMTAVSYPNNNPPRVATRVNLTR